MGNMPPKLSSQLRQCKLAIILQGVVMNNTFNYSFLVDKYSEESYQHKSFIPADIIAEKYADEVNSDIRDTSSLKDNSSKTAK